MAKCAGLNDLAQMARAAAFGNGGGDLAELVAMIDKISRGLPLGRLSASGTRKSLGMAMGFGNMTLRALSDVRN
jgi:hypothetical protein